MLKCHFITLTNASVFVKFLLFIVEFAVKGPNNVSTKMLRQIANTKKRFHKYLKDKTEFWLQYIGLQPVS